MRPGRGSFFMSARVHLPGSPGRASASAGGVGYIATREGADRGPTPEDEARAGLAGYAGARPGSTALFDRDGAVAVAAAERAVAQADGALLTLVMSVRREEADELRLACKRDWERYLRSELDPALARMMGVPESDVRWVAAEHGGQRGAGGDLTAGEHVHVIAWSASGRFAALVGRRDLAEGRRALAAAALAPAMPAALADRDAARDAAIAAMREVTAADVRDLGLPPDGRISYGHLRRWHPDAAARVASELDRLSAARPEIEDVRSSFREAVLRCAWLRGLEGDAAERVAEKAARDLDARLANALLRVVAPDRTRLPREGGAPQRRLEPAPDHGPGSLRMRIPAPMPRESGPGDTHGRSGYASAALRKAARALTAASDESRQLSDEVGRETLRLIAAVGGSALAAAIERRSRRPEEALEHPVKSKHSTERSIGDGEVVQHRTR
ncbi:hypothetical protein H6A16_04445 [Collinsella tanakaei]|uniref:hypothetical protein n=1 Tax=Collinsella tanakaei TaxID=626935 RepID=UPI001956D4D8|nr:hypothetical protein [Collinsella tanakaei]MBM6778745.1 hypothetical protein [Collinsella tanakaei]